MHINKTLDVKVWVMRKFCNKSQTKTCVLSSRCQFLLSTPLLDREDKQSTRILTKLAFQHAGTCLTLLFSALEENLRGMNERMNYTHSGFLILDIMGTSCKDEKCNHV